MYLEIFLADFAVFHVFLGISLDFAEIPEFRGSATARNIRSLSRMVVIQLQQGIVIVHDWSFLEITSTVLVSNVTLLSFFNSFYETASKHWRE